MAKNLAPNLRARINPGAEVEIPLENCGGEVLRLKLFETVIHSCPAHFFIAFAANEPDSLPAWLTAWRAAAGRGLDREGAREAAIWEALERASAMTGGFDDPRATHLDARPASAPDPAGLWQYSANQLHDLWAKWNFQSNSSCGKDVDNLWLTSRHLTSGSSHAVPATAVLLEEDRRLGLGGAFTSSTGTAARDDLEAATRHAVLERIERDAVAIWWYNRLVPPRLSAAAAETALPGPLASWLRERRRVTWHLLMPHDLPATSCVALSARADGSRPAIGAAAALEPSRAVLSATLEMLQGEIALAQMRAAAPADPPPLLAWSDETNALAAPELRGEGTAELPPSTMWQHLLDALTAAVIDVYVADLTRPELAVPVVKAVSPQLRDWLPRFAPGRLYDLPVALGLKSAPTPEAELNPVPFVI